MSATDLAEKHVLASRLLTRVANDFRPSALASSLSAEDMVLTDLIARERADIGIFVIDTGRLHGDTLDLIDRIEGHYGLDVELIHPRPDKVAEFVGRHGRDAFYESVELRQSCCAIRKVEPLKRALAGKKAWITGLRREQSATRVAIAAEAFDSVHGLAKFNPLADWSEDDVWTYIRAHGVPYNPLYDQGYRSIGCAPCTRPVVAGEDARAGRWWWEAGAASECGLHVSPTGKLVRSRETA